MSTRTRKPLDDTQMTAVIMKESAEPRLAASVRKALEQHPAPAVTERLGGNKFKTARLRAIMRATRPAPPGSAMSTTMI